MKSIVKPFELTENQKEGILMGYASLLTFDEIMEEFQMRYKTQLTHEFKVNNPDWYESLELAIRHLDPAHPEFDDKYSMLFNDLRRSYRSSLDGFLLSTPQGRMRELERSKERLETLARQFPEAKLAEAVKCEESIVKIIQQSQEEAYRFAEANKSKSGLSQEETKKMLRQLTPQQLAEFKTRYKQGETEEMIFLDLLNRMRVENDKKETDDGNTVPETSDDS